MRIDIDSVRVDDAHRYSTGTRADALVPRHASHITCSMSHRIIVTLALLSTELHHRSPAVRIQNITVLISSRYYCQYMTTTGCAAPYLLFFPSFDNGDLDNDAYVSPSYKLGFRTWPCRALVGAACSHAAPSVSAVPIHCICLHENRSEFLIAPMISRGSRAEINLRCLLFNLTSLSVVS